MSFLFRQAMAVKERSVSVILLSGGQGKRMGVHFLLLQTFYWLFVQKIVIGNFTSFDN